jgi:hypothetical protein
MILRQNYYAIVDNREREIPRGDPFPQEGYLSEIKIDVRPYPPYNPRLQQQHNALARLVERVNTVFIETLKAFKDAFGDINATTDLMKLLQTGTKLAKDTFDIPSFQAISLGFAPIIEFIYARAIFSRAFDIFSGDAAHKEPLFGGCDYLRILNKVFMLGNDTIYFLKWFSTVGLLEQFVEKKIGTIPVFGYGLEMTIGRGLSKCGIEMTIGKLPLLCILFGTIPNLIDNLRLVVKYAKATDMLEQERKAKLVGYSLDCISDICRIAFSILFLLSSPGVIPGLAFYGIVAQGIGTCGSLSKFYYNAHTRAALEKEKNDHIEKKAAAKALCEQYLQFALGEFDREGLLYTAQFPSLAEAAIEGAQRGMDKKERPFMQPLNAESLAHEVLARASIQGDPQIQGLIMKALELWNACNAHPIPA